MSSTIFFLMLFLLRVLLRKQWIAAVAFVAITSIVPAIGSANPVVGHSRKRAILRRGGVCAPAIRTAGDHRHVHFPPGADNLPAHAGPLRVVCRAGADPLLAVASIAIYGFRTSLAGRPVFRISGEIDQPGAGLAWIHPPRRQECGIMHLVFLPVRIAGGWPRNAPLQAWHT